MLKIFSLLGSKYSTALRLIAALLLGLQFGLLAFFQVPSLAWIWVPWLPLAILFAALLVSIWLDPQVRGGTIDAERVLEGLVRFLMVILAPIAAIIIAFFFIRSVGALMLALIPLVLGVITSFTIVGKRQAGLAIICGLLAWSGVGIPFLLATYLSSRDPANTLGGLVFVLLVIGVGAGFLFAGLGGFLGRLLRRWVLE